MSEELLRELLKVKLKIADSAINILPPVLKDRTRALEKSILKVICEVTGDYLNKPSDENKKEVKTINID